MWQFPCGTCFKVFVMWEQLSFFTLSSKIWTFRKVNFSLWLLCCQGSAPNCVFIPIVVHGCCLLATCRFCTPCSPQEVTSLIWGSREQLEERVLLRTAVPRRATHITQGEIQWFSHGYGKEALTLGFWEIFCTTPLFLPSLVPLVMN